jgi:hypothetical protein
MGGATFDSGHWASFSATKVRGKSTAAVFASRALKESLDPRKMKNMLRESCDDAVCPNSTAIIVALDETGSMGIIPDYMIRVGFPKLFEEIYNRKPVTDPHVMFMGVGDAEVDTTPIQVSQFEAGMRLADQLTDMFLEGGGGGNHYEGYTFPWYLAAMHTKIDCFDKRNKKGYLFTVGDEEPNPILYRADIERSLGIAPQTDLTAEQLLDMVSKQYHVFHVIVEEGSHARSYPDQTKKAWTNLLGEHVLRLADHTKLSEVIVSAIQVIEGTTVDSVVKSWSGDTSLVVAKAIGGLTTTQAATGVVRF